MIDVIIIGGGINGLVAAIALARDKRSVLVLDQRDTVGGAAVTATSANGFRTPTLSHSLGPLSADVVRTLQLDGARSKLKFLLPDPVLTTLGRSGEIISFHRDDVLTAASINQVSPIGRIKGLPHDITGLISRWGTLPKRGSRTKNPRAG